METSLKPLFIEAPQGRLFAVYYAPHNVVSSAEAIIYLPPFTEEMNRSRRMVSLQARAFAAQGIGVLLLDLFGTGDSEGEFGEARWDIWLDNVNAAADWLSASGHSALSLWGLRSGALIACEAAARRAHRFHRLLLWHPVSDGKSLMTQFLRIRVAAALSGQAAETTEHLRGTLAAGTPIEVAGYELAPELVAAIDRATLSAINLPSDVAVIWLEVSRTPGDALLPAGKRIVDSWRARGLAVEAEAVPGIPFWNIQETTTAPALIDASIRLMSGQDAAPDLPI